MIFLVKLLNVNPQVWREIAVPENYTFEDFHRVIQRSMGWKDIHMHEFRIYRGSEEYVIRPVYDLLEDFNVLDERKQRLTGWLDERTLALYVYDFKDEWIHSVELLKTVDAISNHPMLIGGMGACPPEGIGGPHAYTELIEALNDPQNRLHGLAFELLGEDFDPDYFDPGSVDFQCMKNPG